MLSKKQTKEKEFFTLQSSGKRTITPLTENQFKQVKRDFYSNFAPKFGFYGSPVPGIHTPSLEKAIKNDGYFIYEWQDKVIHEILKSIFMQKNMDINIAVMRQVGKTEIVSLCTAYVFQEFYNHFGVPINIAVFAPVKSTATIMFKRACQYIPKDLIAADGDTKERKESVRGDEIQLFGIYDETKGSTIEGHTFDMIIRDEAHKGNDTKFADETEPTRFSKRAPLIMIGNGGNTECLFYKNIKEGNKTDSETGFENRVIRYTFDQVKPYFEKLIDMGLRKPLNTIQSVTNYIKKHGETSYEVQKNVYCRWKMGMSHPILAKHVEQCSFDEVRFWEMTKPTHIYMSVDFATLHDQTVATFMNPRKEIIDWCVVKEKYEVSTAREQCEILFNYCEKMGYTSHLVAIGFDATGLGSFGVIEYLEDRFGCDLVPYKFTGQSKHDWYKAFIESLITEIPENRIKIPRLNKWYDQFRKECIELQEEPPNNENKKYSSFAAPQRTDCFDDFIASAAIVLDMVNIEHSAYNLMKDDWIDDKIPEWNPYAAYSPTMQTLMKN